MENQVRHIVSVDTWEQTPLLVSYRQWGALRKNTSTQTKAIPFTVRGTSRSYSIKERLYSRFIKKAQYTVTMDHHMLANRFTDSDSPSRWQVLYSPVRSARVFQKKSGGQTQELATERQFLTTYNIVRS